jgi:rSAM/selenodomain-associated transferase 2
LKISVIIPVYNEQKTINETVEHVRSIGECEIIVSDSNGETLKAVTDKDVILVHSEKGRGKQMNSGAEQASGDILLFLHADTRLPVGAFQEVEKITVMRGAGAFDLAIDSDKFIFRIIERLSSLRSRITRTPYGDQAIFVSKVIFDRIGGYRDYPIMEDVALMNDIMGTKIKIKISRKRVRTSARRWLSEGIIYTTLRNWFIITLYYFGADPQKLKRFYK